MEPRPACQREMSTASTFARIENNPFVIDMTATRGSGGPVDNSAQRVQRSRASGGNIVARDDHPLITLPEGIHVSGPRQNPDRADQQLQPPEVARRLQFSAQRPDNIFEDQGRQNPPASEHYPRSPVLEAGQRQLHSLRELAVPRSPAQNHARENPPLEVARNQQLIEIPPSRDSVQRSQRNIAVVGNDGLQGRRPHPARDFLQPRTARAEPNLDMARVAQTAIPIIEFILTLSQSIVWILILLFFFMVLALITLRIVRFFFPVDALTDSPRLLFRFVGSGYSNAATIYEVVFPLSVSNPFLFIIAIVCIILVTYIMACCVKVCSTSPRC